MQTSAVLTFMGASFQTICTNQSSRGGMKSPVLAEAEGKNEDLVITVTRRASYWEGWEEKLQKGLWHLGWNCTGPCGNGGSSLTSWAWAELPMEARASTCTQSQVV